MVDEEKCVKAATGSSLQSTVYAVLVHFTSQNKGTLKKKRIIWS